MACEGTGIDPDDPNQFEVWLPKENTRQTANRRETRLFLNTGELFNGLADQPFTRRSGTGYLGRYPPQELLGCVP